MRKKIIELVKAGHLGQARELCAARLVYCAMAPLVLVGGLFVDIIGDLHSFLLRVVRTVYYAFGGG